MKEKIFQSQNINLNYIEGPDHNTRILLIHGGSSRWQSFLPILSDLTKNLHVFALDLRGHGKSGRAGSYKIEDYAKDVFYFIKEHIKKPTVIFGNSLGGMVAIIIAAYHPELVSSLIIGDSPITNESLHNLISSQRDSAHQIIHWLNTNQIKNIYEEIKDDHFAESLSQCDPNMLVAMFDKTEFTFKKYSTNKLFPLITCPVLIIRGNIEKGSLISDSDINEAINLLAHVTQAQLPNIGHSLMEDKSSLIREIKSFIKNFK